MFIGIPHELSSNSYCSVSYEMLVQAEMTREKTHPPPGLPLDGGGENRRLRAE
jgi:hypothetical protein